MASDSKVCRDVVVGRAVAVLPLLPHPPSPDIIDRNETERNSVGMQSTYSGLDWQSRRMPLLLARHHSPRTSEATCSGQRAIRPQVA